jgi:hypothetical protein
LPDGEGSVRPAWIRFAAVGEPERGFVQFGTETWCYVRRGPYAAFVVVGPAARPGLVIDHMDQLLLSAEESRVNRPAAGDEPVVIGAQGEAAVAAAAVHAASPAEGAGRPTEAVGSIAAGTADPADGGTRQPTGAPSPGEGPPPGPPEPSAEEPSGLDAGLWDVSDDGSEVDRFSLAREFGQLLQDPDEGADG